MIGERLSESWILFKLNQWRETSDSEAVAKYVKLWGCSDISAAARTISTPMLVIGAEQDSPPFLAEALKTGFLPYYPHADFVSFQEVGHYPMQEQPPLFTTVGTLPGQVGHRRRQGRLTGTAALPTPHNVRAAAEYRAGPVRVHGPAPPPAHPTTPATHALRSEDDFA